MSQAMKQAISEEPLEKAALQAKKKGPEKPFLEKLHEMLQDSECNDWSQSIVSWQPHGRAFRVHNVEKFVEHILPKYFKHSQVTSFQRQLNLYCFRRLTTGVDKGSYYHESFLRGQPYRWREMRRIRVKGNNTRTKPDFESEPNFYTLPPSIISQSRNWDTGLISGEQFKTEDTLYVRRVLPGSFDMPSLPLTYLEMSFVQKRDICFDVKNSLSSAEKVNLPPSSTSFGSRTIQETTQGLFRKQSVNAEELNWRLGTNLGPHSYCSEDNVNKTDAAHCNMLSLGFDYNRSNDSCVSYSKVSCFNQDNGVQCYRDEHSFMNRHGSVKGFNYDVEMPTDSRRNSLLSTVCNESYSQRNENSLHILCASLTEDDKHTPSIDANVFEPLPFDELLLEKDFQPFCSNGTSFQCCLDAGVSSNEVKGTQPCTSICDSLMLLRDEEKPSIKVRRNSFLSSTAIGVTNSQRRGKNLRFCHESKSQADKTLKKCVENLLSEDLIDALDSNICN